MNKIALMHKAKSEYAYAYDQNTLHILLRTGKNDMNKVSLIYGDPFEWEKKSANQFAWVHQIEPMTKRYQTEFFDFYFLEIKPRNKRVKYAFILKNDSNIYLYGTRHLKHITNENELFSQYDLSDYFNFPFLHEKDLHQTPSWVKDVVWYQIFPDRFASFEGNSNLKWGKLPVANNELYGGNLKGVTNKLPYLHDLGITGIYFTPIFEAPTAHKYDTTNYYKIDPQFGTLDDFKKLVSEAHKLNIKIMLDGVFNHAGYHHEFFQDVLKNNEKSIYKDSFHIEKFPILNDQNELRYKAFAFAKAMPKWRTEDKYAEEHLLGVIKYWIKECDIDGWRLDVSNEVTHDFLRKIKDVARETKKDVFILGENLDDSTPWLQGDQLDGAMNYDFSFPSWEYFEHKIDLNTFRETIITYLAKTPKNVIHHMFNLVGCHDTIRIKARLGENTKRVKLSNLWMFTAAGNPNIYYGDEIGLTGQMDPDNRRCMIWDEQNQDLDLKSFMKKLIELRNTYSALSTPDYHFIDSNQLVYIKKDQKHEILVIMNNDENKNDIHLSKELSGNYINLFNLENLNIHDKITLEGYDYLVLLKGV